MDAVARVVAAARVAARRLGPLDTRRGRGRALAALLDAAGPGEVGEARGAAAIETIWRRDRPLDRVGDPWSLQLDAAALGLGPLLEGGAAELGRLVAERLGDGLLLDAGGGLGDVTRAALDKAPGARAIVVDRPEVLAAARRALPGRAELHAADLASGPLPGGARVAVLSHVLHMHAPETAARIVGRVAACLGGGGTLLVRELRPGSLRACAASVVCLVHGDGEIYDEPTLRGWLLAAGLPRVELLAHEALVLAARAC